MRNHRLVNFLKQGSKVPASTILRDGLCMVVPYFIYIHEDTRILSLNVYRI